MVWKAKIMIELFLNTPTELQALILFGVILVGWSAIYG